MRVKKKEKETQHPGYAQEAGAKRKTLKSTLLTKKKRERIEVGREAATEETKKTSVSAKPSCRMSRRKKRKTRGKKREEVERKKQERAKRKE